MPGPCLQGYGSWMQLGLWTHCRHPELRKGFLKQAYLPILSVRDNPLGQTQPSQKGLQGGSRVPIQLSKAVTLRVCLKESSTAQTFSFNKSVIQTRLNAL